MTEAAGITDAVFRAVRSGNAFEETVERLLEGIKLGIYAPGDRLPAERELTARLGVSRITLRDALRELGAAGYVETKRGRFGGTFVVRAPEPPSLAALASADGAADLLEDALVFRAVVETGAAEMAAQATLSRAQREELSECLLTVQSFASEGGAAIGASQAGGSHTEGDLAGGGLAGRGLAGGGLSGGGLSGGYRAADTRLHLAIADAAGAPSLTASVVQARVRLVDLLNAIPMLPPNLHNANVQHVRIVRAILAGDPTQARDAMAEHVAGTAALLRGFLRGQAER